MKSLLTLILFSFLSTLASAQFIDDAELTSKLSGKETFHEIAYILQEHYEDKIRSAPDSSTYKLLKRKYKKLNRKLWWDEHFLNSEGKVENRFSDLVNIHDQLVAKNASDNRHQILNWEHDGPSEVSFDDNMGEGIGRIDVIAFHPSNASIIYAGSSNGGLFRTLNGGVSWSPLTSFLPSMGIAAIYVDPDSPENIYILTGDRNSGVDGFVSSFKFLSPASGIYKSSDNGISWNKLNTFLSDGTYRARDMAIHPTNPNILIVTTDNGVFRTTNGGNTWSLVLNEFAWDVAFKPGSTSIVYVTTQNAFFRSEDGGVSFSQTELSIAVQATHRISLAVTPADPNLVMLLAGGIAASLTGILKSTDSGVSFEKTYPLDEDQDDLFHNYIDINSTDGQATYNNTIAISPTDPDIILVGGLCIWSSDDGGFDWTQETAYWAWSPAEYIHPDQHDLAWHPNGKVYVGNDGGVYVSDDDGFSWDFISNGLAATQFYRFEFANDEGDTWGGAQDNGMLERESGSDFYIFSGGDGFDLITDHPYNADDGESDDIYYTVNETIQGDLTEISVPGNENFFGNLGMDPSDEDHIYVGYREYVYETYDAGSNWELLSTRPANWALSTCRNNSNRIYIAGRNEGNGKMFRLVGFNEFELTGNLIDVGYNTNNKITDIEVWNSNFNHVYISCAGFTTNSKVFFSDDGGDSWDNWTFNLPNVPVFSLERDPAGGLYAGTFIGVFYKQIDNDYWEHFSNGLPVVPVTDIELYNFLAGTPNNVMISTFGRGLYKAPVYQQVCPNTLNLTGTVVGTFYKDVNTSITSTQEIRASAGTHVRYNAGSEIRLIPGFHAKGPGVLKTYLLGCGAELDLGNP